MMMDEITELIGACPYPLSVEANSGFGLDVNDIDYTAPVSPHERYDPSETFLDLPVSGSCNYKDLVGAINSPIESNGFEVATQSLLRAVFQDDSDVFYIPDTTALALNNFSSTSPIRTKHTDGKSKRNSSSIPLSHSVGVSAPQILLRRNDLEIVNDLELTFRPRYKSDYFGQNGKNRKPRYVADRLGNHYVTLRVPPGLSGQIRVDWLTLPTKSGQRYSMPYHFQASNESQADPDRNPLFIDIPSESKTNGFMKLYLVLIKSKQDALKGAQPLKLFQPLTDALVEKPNKSSAIFEYMTPKKLIQEFKLEQSQLAFTLCMFTDEKSIKTLWHTTAYSSILTELTTESSPRQKVDCPKCKFTFDVPSNGDDAGEGGISLKSTSQKRKRQVDNCPKALPVVNNFKKRSASDWPKVLPVVCNIGEHPANNWPKESPLVHQNFRKGSAGVWYTEQLPVQKYRSLSDIPAFVFN